MMISHPNVGLPAQLYVDKTADSLFSYLLFLLTINLHTYRGQ